MAGSTDCKSVPLEAWGFESLLPNQTKTKMSKIKTLNDLINYERHLTQMFDSDVRVAMALLEEIRKLNEKK